MPFIGKAVSRANRSIGSDGFFYRTEHGTVESKLVVKPIYSDLDFDTNAPITIGTIEIRVYLLRRFDEEQSIQMQKFHECVDEGHDTAKPVGYNSIKPDYAMTFEKDLGEIELRIRNKAQKAMNTVRPGTAPWAIFRFHYRDRSKFLTFTFDLLRILFNCT